MGGGASSQAEPPLPPIRRSISEAQAHVRADYDGDTLLSADVGGTGSRLHLFLPPDTTHPKESDFFVPPERMIFEKQYKNERFDSFMDVLKTFLREAGLERPPLLACLAVAGVVVDNSARFVNLGWDISGRKIEEALGIQRVELVNDFVAQGYGILTLNPKKDCQVLQDAPIKHGAPIAVIGAGTGLGEAYLAVGAQGDYEVWPSEGGHAEYAPRQEGSNSLETELLQYLLIKYSEKARVSVERVAAGRGIANIYEFLAWKYPEKVNRAVHRSFVGPIEGPRTFDPAAITKAASTGSCELSRKAVDIWAGAYGSEAGVVALTYMPFGGLYLTGGVTSKMKDWLSGKTTGQSTFLEAFLDKGRVTTMLMRVPVFLVQGEDMGERGAMLKATRIYLEQQNERRMSQASRSTGAPEFIMRPSAVTMKPGGVQDMATVQEAEEEIVSEVP